MRCYHAHRWSEGGLCKNCGAPTEYRFCSPDCQKSYWDKNNDGSHQRRYWERKIGIMRMLGARCSVCGNEDLRVLDIHHIDPTQKVIPADRQYSWTRRLRDWDANLENLELLCANCHRIHTWDQMGYGVGLELDEFSLEQS